MISNSTWQHLRIPFSIFLSPVYFFALSQSQDPDLFNALLSFICLHIFVYPASNGFNSFYDKDEKSIGGLKNPPKVENQLLIFSLLFDAIGFIIALFISLEFAFCIFLYGIVSKAYSHPAIRLKKSPIFGLLAVGIFQGYLIYIAVNQFLIKTDLTAVFHPEIQIPAIISTVLLLGSYPMTQIYQHEEDKKRGDITISLILGIKGTFIFTMIMFLFTDILFAYYFYSFGDFQDFIILQLFLAPVLIYFNWWMLKSWKNENEVNFERTMLLNSISSVCMIIFFLYLIIF